MSGRTHGGQPSHDPHGAGYPSQTGKPSGSGRGNDSPRNK